MPAPEKEFYGLTDSVLLVVDSYMHVFNNKSIKVITEVADPSTLVEADRSQMEQVLANIIKNSIEAMESGGRFTAKSGKTEHPIPEQIGSSSLLGKH